MLTAILNDARTILSNVEMTSKEIGFYLIAVNTEFVCLHQDASYIPKNFRGESIKKLTGF